MIRLRVVTPHGDGFDEEVERVVVRGIEGDLALMKSTAPIVTPLQISRFIVTFPGGEERVGVINGGYVSMIDDVATIVTDSTEWVDEIDRERAQAAKDRANKRLNDAASNEDIDVKRAEIALKRALNRLDLVE